MRSEVMSEIPASFYVIRRVEAHDNPGAPELCATFVSRARAEAFITLSTAPFAARGSEGDGWWCLEDDNHKVEYWIESDHDDLVKDLLDSANPARRFIA